MRLITIAALAACIAAPAQAAGPKNIIVMIADGAGHNTLAATRLWKGGPLAVDAASWRRASMATYPLRRDAKPADGASPTAQDRAVIYDSARNWDTRTLAGMSKVKSRYPALFRGYEWNRETAPDSAGTMTAMMTGVRTYNGAIDVDGAGQPVRSIAEAAKAAGKMTGSISSVPFDHATPAAGGGAHNVDRGAYAEIAREMFGSGTLDVLGGGGNPGYDQNGQAAAKPDYRWLPKDIWERLKAGREDGWRLVQSRADIDALARGAAHVSGRLAMLPEVAATLQEGRNYAAGTEKLTATPGETPKIAAVPTLASMALAALNHVAGERRGFFLHVEGGAVDWAMHDNAFGRMIEEYLDFNDAVAAVVRWIDSPESAASWDDTLLIVTADHDHLLFGPNSAVPFQRPTDNGAGKLPGYSWASDSHSNQLVPIFARGAGADRLMALADRRDAYTDGEGRRFGYGPYLTQPELGGFLIATEK